MNKIEFDNRSSAVTLIDLLKRNANFDKKIVFFTSSTEQSHLSYRDLYQHAQRIAMHLSASGIHPGSEVIFQFRDPRHFLCLYWACLITGVLPVPITMADTDERRNKLLTIFYKLTNPTVVFDALDLVALRQYQVASGRFTDQPLRTLSIAALLDETDTSLPPTYSPGEHAFIQYSSGSSGNPKGVLLSHRNLICNARDIYSKSYMTPDSRQLSWMPLTHDMGLIGFHLTGVFGNLDQFIMPPELFIKRPLLWMDKISTYKITHTYSPNFGYRYLLAAIPPATTPSWDLSSLRLMYNGAEPISDKLCDEFETTLAACRLPSNVIFPAYGLAEASVAVTIHESGRRNIKYLDRNSLAVGSPVRHDDDGMPVVSSGTPLAACQVRIANDEDALLPAQHIGNIQIKGDNVTAGYYLAPELNTNLFTADGWLRTGDLGFFSGHELYVTGRKKSLIILHGENHYPEDIERCLQAVPGVEMGKIAVASVAAEEEEEKLIVFLSTRQDKEKTATIVRDVQQTLLRQFNLLAHDVIFIPRIPRTTSGKTERHTLQQIYQARAAQAKPATPADGRTLHEALADILRTYMPAPPGPDDNFFNSGLNSLSAMRITFDIQAQLNRAVSITDLFLHPTINRLTVYLETDDDGSTPVTPVAAASTGQYATSFAQQRLWILGTLDPDQNNSLTVRFSVQGDISPQALECAWREIIRRHEILRTAFTLTDGALYQVVRPVDTPPAIQHHSIAPQAIPAFLQHLAHTPIPLTAPDLVRFHILPVPPRACYGVLHAHHILVDGWSIEVLQRELLTILSEGSTSLAPLAFQYKDYAAWYTQEVETPAYQRYRNFWTHTYADGFPTYTFPAGRSSSAPVARAHTVTRALSAPMLALLRRHTEQQETTVFTGLVAVLSVILSRHTPEQEAFFGIPTAGRISPSLKDQIGYYLNILPVHLTPDETRSFVQLLATVRQEINLLYQHQHYPLEKITGLNASAIRANALFDVLVLFQNFTPRATSTDEKIVITSEEISHDTVTANLYFEFLAHNDTVSLRLKYNSGRYIPEQIEYLLDSFELLLHHGLQQPHTALAVLPRVPAVSSLSGAAIYNTLSPHTVLDLFHQQTERHTDDIFLSVAGRTFTYRDIDACASQLAERLLHTYGIAAQDLVILYLDRSELMIIAMLATWKTGAICIPIDAQTPQQRLAAIAADCTPLRIVTDQSLDIVPADTIIIPVTLPVLTPGTDVPAIRTSYPANHIAYRIYTSGSTGTPKAVAVSHASLMHATAAWIDCYQLDQYPVRVMQVASFGFDVFIGDLCRSMCTGGSVVICPADARGDAEYLYQLLQEHAITLFESTPSIILPLLGHIEQHQYSHDFLKVIVVGSEGWLHAHYCRLRNFLAPTVRLINSYGTTETTIDSLYFESMEPATVHAVQTPIGKPLAHVTCHILDRYQRPVPRGVPGELYIGGAGVSEGYSNQPDATALKFIANPFGQGKLYKTGDVVRLLGDGNIEFIRRSDSQVKIRGYRIEPAEIEHHVMRYPGITSALVIARELRGEKVLVAYLTGTPPDRQALRAHLLQVLPGYMVPGHFLSVAALPLKLNGKIDIGRLPLPATDEDDDDITPSNDLEQEVIRTWKAVLQVEHISRSSDFFHLGGQSIKAIQIVSRVNKALGTAITLPQLFQHPVLHDFAALLQQPESIRPAESPVADRYHVSSGQQSIYLHNQLSQCPALYNLAEAFRLDGEIDIPALEQSIHGLASRHDILRTIFTLHDDGLRQIILPALPAFGITHRQLSGKEVVDDVLHTLACTEFDLTAPPLFQASVVVTADDEPLLVFVMHHIISDAISAGIIFRELSAIYAATVRQQPDPLPVPGAQYRHFVHAQQQFRRANPLSPAYLQHLQHGVTRLNMAGTPAAVHEKDYRAGHIVLDVTPALALAIDRAAEEEKVSPFALWASALVAMLHYQTGLDRLSIAYPCTERDLINDEGCLGFFSNMQALPASLSSDTTFQQLIHQVQHALGVNMAWRSYSFDQITQALAEQGVQLPAIEVSLVVNEPDLHAPLTFGPTTAVPRKIRTPYAKYDITFCLNRIAGEHSYELDIEYRSTAFTPSQIDAMGRRFLHLAGEIPAQRQTPVRSHTMFLPSDHTAYEIFNQTTAPALLDRSLVTLLIQSFALHADKTALQFSGESIHYRELNLQTAGIAGHLTNAYGIGPGDIVAVCLNRSLYLPVVILSILRTGAAFLPIDPSLGAQRQEYVLQDAAARLLINDTTLPEILTRSAGHRSIDQTQNIYRSEAPVYIMYTSGSTGNPKGVTISHASLSNYLLWFNRYYLDGGAGFPTCLFTSIGFDLTMSSLLAPLLRGDTLHIYPEENPIALLQAIFRDTQDINTIKITPSHIFLIDSVCAVNTTLKKVIVGGEKMTDRHIDLLRAKAPHADIYNEYGPTETTIGSSVFPIHDRAEASLIGTPIANTRIYIAHDSLALAPVGVPGEILIAGAGVSQGYWRNPPLTEEKFVLLPGTNERVYRTGDLGIINFDGRLEYINRKDNQLKIQGYRIEPSEIEMTLLREPHVDEALVLSRVFGTDTVLVAYLTLSQPVNVRQIRESLMQKLPSYMVPAYFIDIAGFHLTVNGKIDRSHLPFGDAYFMREETVVQLPASHLEDHLLQLWKSALQTDSVGIDSNFFSHGGNSLKVIQLFNAIEKKYPRAIDIGDIYNHPTPRMMSTVIDAQTPQQTQPENEFIL